jgi:uncharacterized protein
MRPPALQLRRRAIVLLWCALLATGAVACGKTTARSGLPTGTLFLGTSQVPVHVEIAETESARQRGLMGRTSLGSDDGMAFLFDQPVTASFYMKDTLIPLSIVFWDRSARVVAILDMDPCRADPCPQYSPGVAFIGAAEANQGFFRAHGVRVGDKVELER